MSISCVSSCTAATVHPSKALFIAGNKSVKNVFATGQYRTVRPLGSLATIIASWIVFKLLMAASGSRRRLMIGNQLAKMIEAVRLHNSTAVFPISADCAT